MTHDVVFWGAGGQARVLRELLAESRLVALFDNDRAAASPFDDVPIFHGKDGFARWLSSWRGGEVSCLVAIGGERGLDRVALQRDMELAGLQPIVARHRTAFVAASAKLGLGTQILAQAAVAVDAVLGLACIVNTGATVDHECVLGDGVHVAPGAHLAGCVEVGAGAFIGTGAAVLPRIKIGKSARVGAGAVVTRDVREGATVVGNPARETKDPT
ncbi:MAG: transferase hexapeptide repeat containing protein [Myxococcales bacterium]|nr:transferase hexapeptide repeat containing protein [Myxococcales bacterium]